MDRIDKYLKTCLLCFGCVISFLVTIYLLQIIGFFEMVEETYCVWTNCGVNMAEPAPPLSTYRRDGRDIFDDFFDNQDTLSTLQEN